MVYGHGINDMPKNWTVENEWNKRVYKTWINMLKRCYSEKLHEIHTTYKECSVCKKWLILSNFVKEFKLIDGYDEKKFLNGQLQLDKDIKSNGANKEYSLNNCLLVSKTENVRQANKTRDYSNISIKIAQYDRDGNLIKIWNSAMDIERELGIKNGNIITCCKFWKMNCNKEEWFKIHKSRPNKTAGGFIFKYAIEEQ